MADIEVNYKGVTIKSINASGTTQLKTAGTWCEDDIDIVYTRPSGSGITCGTVEYNQLASLLSADWHTARANITFSGTNTILTTTSASSTKYAQFALVQNHKYFYRGTFAAPAGSTLAIGIYSGTTVNTYSTRHIVNAGVTETVKSIVVNDTYANGQFRIQHATGAGSGVVGTVNDLNVFDITAFFGATVADYIYNLEQATPGAGIDLMETLFFAAQYYAYDAGSEKTIMLV